MARHRVSVRELPRYPTTPLGHECFHDLLEAHLGRLAAGVTLIFSVLKVLSVAHFDVTTALASLPKSNSAPLLLGAVVTAIDFVLLVVMASLLYVALDEKAIQGPDSRIYAVLGLVVAVLAAALAPLPASIVVFLPGLTILGQRGLRNRRSTRHLQAIQKQVEERTASDEGLDLTIEDILREEMGLIERIRAVGEMEERLAQLGGDQGELAVALGQVREGVLESESKLADSDSHLRS